MNIIIITGTFVNHMMSRFTRGPGWIDSHATTAAPRVTATRDPTITTSVTTSIHIATEIIEGIAATIHSEGKDALIIQITEIHGN